ncbi:hypothetical protein SNEBB_007860 [Seison nebaliae]|nr:hypothetical protein SNEBB_007860 [Seison nebaliae]
MSSLSKQITSFVNRHVDDITLTSTILQQSELNEKCLPNNFNIYDFEKFTSIYVDEKEKKLKMLQSENESSVETGKSVARKYRSISNKLDCYCGNYKQWHEDTVTLSNTAKTTLESIVLKTVELYQKVAVLEEDMYEFEKRLDMDAMKLVYNKIK